MACINNYNHRYPWIVNTRPYSLFNDDLAKLFLNLGHGWVIASTGNLGMRWLRLLIHTQISNTLRQSKRPLMTVCTWRRHEMETFSALLVLCAGNSPVTGEFPSQRPVTRSFDAGFDLRQNKRLSKQSRHRWFEAPSCSSWRHCNYKSSIKWRYSYIFLLLSY